VSARSSRGCAGAFSTDARFLTFVSAQQLVCLHMKSDIDGDFLHWCPMPSSDPITVCPEHRGGWGSGMATVDSFFVIRTMQALEVIAFQPSSAPQVAEVLRVDARTARRLLNRLTAEGWLVRTEGRVRTYTLSLRLVALASHFLERTPITKAATTVARDLHEQTGGVAYVVIPSYRAVLVLAQCAADRASRPHARELIPAHATAGGKLLLAHRAQWRESVLELPLERLTERTIVDADALRDECRRTLERGYGFDDGEYRSGLQSIAAAVLGEAGDVMATVALSGPPALTVGDKLDAVRAAARTLGQLFAEEPLARAA
jgi:DNA-binding IclR family transcriptional regulator